ncbi:hypothetical protein LWI29_013436 [Acer saccharum]|uniref:Uncharacterized protein n=1 Tax=Acer saccharum TaxID=4024 RepID=A0AA39SXS4_ACESA|nr:hypothetical protein LWI29_013436 [Acer saccharum]
MTNHWNVVKRVLRYLKGSLNHGLLIHRSSSNALHAFADADWAGEPDDRRSTTASTTEAEYRAIASTATELTWVGHLLSELQIQVPDPPVIYCDNVGATYVCANPIFHSRMKHLQLTSSLFGIKWHIGNSAFLTSTRMINWRIHLPSLSLTSNSLIIAPR